MANNLLANPIILDTVMTSSYKAQVAASIGTLFTIRIEKVYWYGPVTSGDTFVLQNGSGATLIQGICSGSNISQIFDWTPAPKLWADFQLTQLSSGKIEIYTRF